MADLKDDALIGLAACANVAQFVSFSPDLVQRHSCLSGSSLNVPFSSVNDALEALFEASAVGTLNVRTFHPRRVKGLPFHYGLRTTGDVRSALEAEARDGLFTIVNETIDVHDGGVSGVSLGGVVEFSPDDTPRCVEKSGTLTVSTTMARDLFRTVYGPAIGILQGFGASRVEFSLHPLPQGHRHEHFVYWEIESAEAVTLEPDLRWPNNFSTKIGDKAFGLLVAHLLGFPVPRTVVISRTIAPFSFGLDTNTAEVWLRTCPRVQMPGKFSTTRGWQDAFALLNTEDPHGEHIASVISQLGVPAAYSGATVPLVGRDASKIEGVQGAGDKFMLGDAPAEPLPWHVLQDIEILLKRAKNDLGAVRMEWAHDGRKAWVLQLHRAKRVSRRGVICPGTANDWVTFDPSDGIVALGRLIEEVAGKQIGVLVKGSVGVTSHLGDLLRRARVPARMLSESFGVQQELFLEQPDNS